MKNNFKLLILFLLPLLLMGQTHALLWKISGQDLKGPSYLFGTYHTSDKRVIAKADQAMPYLKLCKAYAMELDPRQPLNPLALVGQVTMKKDSSLKAMIPADSYWQIDSLFKKSGQSLSMYDHFIPIITETILEGILMQDEGLTEDSKESAMDIYFSEKAGKMHKKISGIETVDEQLRALTFLSYREQADMLLETFRAYQGDQTAPDHMMNWYLNGELDSLLYETNHSGMPEKFYKVILTDRNKLMAERIDILVHKKPTFIAVGALHLPGNTGLIALLKILGYTLTAVTF